ncbi:MAG: thiamine pyrophosphate-dependent enzyme [Acidiferrobacterales bacterium]|nr:thiamine pyrophosphate-dependent enzyme [Acidiferrobacterales bacterium]
MLKRDDALKALAAQYADGIAVGAYQGLFDWMQIRPDPLNYLCTGAMGQASSHGLGIALGAPDEKVVILDGDGSLLMNLGSLFTIGHAAPKNLVHFVLHNRTYEANGEFPVLGSKVIQFEELAQIAGYRHSFAFSDIAEFKSMIKHILGLKGPVFVNLHVEPGEPYPRDYKVIHSLESRTRFRDALHARLFARQQGDGASHRTPQSTTDDA